MRTQRFLREAAPPGSTAGRVHPQPDPHPSQFGLQRPVRGGPDALLSSLGLPFFAPAAPQHGHLHEGSHWGAGVSPGLLRPFPVTSQAGGSADCWGAGRAGTQRLWREGPGRGTEASRDPTSPPGRGGHSVSSAESLTSLGLNLALSNTPSGLSVNIPSCPEGPLRITLTASRGGPGRLRAEVREADFPLSTLWALGLYNH